MSTTVGSILIIALLALGAATPSAHAGRLGKVSRGSGDASQGSAPRSSGSTAKYDPTRPDEREKHYGSAHARRPGHPPHEIHLVQPYPEIDLARRESEVLSVERPTVELYAGAQKVVESDGALSVDVAVLSRWVRLGGSVTEYVERSAAGGAPVRVTIPSLTLGVRVFDGVRTRVYAEAGWVMMSTADESAADATLAGVQGGLRVEQLLGQHLALLGDARVMALQADVAAREGRVGLQYRYVRASLRALDFDIGPPLYGPELGIAATF